MLLAIDIGNTDTVIGAYDRETLKASIRLSILAGTTIDGLCSFLEDSLRQMQVSIESVKKVVIGSVVPNLTGPFEESIRRYTECNPIVVTDTIKLPISIDIDQPNEVGADRIANAVAGYIGYGGPLVVVDFGTATTFDVVNNKGVYIGGVIIPGPKTSMAELARKAARLFQVPMEPPQSVVGRSTEDALKSGQFYGTVGQTDYIIEKIIHETTFEKTAIIATGGLAREIEKYSRYIERVEPYLTLDGLRLIGEMN
ncbi:MAG: type III pantothenate kinase [candidate division Zixibacteria bacterium]|nr:type III pantothenate kinase [candidate division Zixibacteria bacterium]